MDGSHNRPQHAGPVWVVFGVGCGVYAVSFFLPAVTTNDMFVGNGTLNGFACAGKALVAGFIGFWTPPGLIAIAAGLLNPITVLYAFWWIAGIRRRLRIAAVIYAAGALVGSFALLTRGMRAKLHVGYLLWAAGIALIFWAPFLDESQAREAEGLSVIPK